MLSNQEATENAIRLLQEARRRIAGGWTQHAHARRADGSSCRFSDPMAVRYCLIGALWAGESVLTAEGQAATDARDALLTVAHALRGAEPGLVLLDWNDDRDRTHEEVLARLDAARERLGGIR